MTATQLAIDIARHAARAAFDKAGRDIIALDVSEHIAYTDVFLLVTAANEPQADAINDEIQARLAAEGLRPARSEGEAEKRWILLDFRDVMVHIQQVDEREQYSLQRLWKDCPHIDLQLPEHGGAGAAESGTQGIDAAESQDSAVEGLTAEGEPTDNVSGEVAGESSDERIAGQ